ncbi:DNAJ heat shock N-terminal domain-containing protein isoform X2 [Wolffia australiana]
MGREGRSQRSSKRRKKKRRDRSESDDSGDDLSVSISGSESDSDESGRIRRRRGDSRKEKKSSKRSPSRKRRREKDKRERRRKRSEKRGSDGDDSSSGGDYGELRKPETALRRILGEFPGAASDLRQMVDSGQAVDVKGISDKLMVKLLKRLFLSLKLKQKEDGVFLLPPSRPPTLDIIVPLLHTPVEPCQLTHLTPSSDVHPPLPSKEDTLKKDEADVGPLEKPPVNLDSVSQPKRFIGPAMPSAELLAAAAALNEAATTMRDADLEDFDEVLIGPPPPALVSEVESTNEAERFEEVTRIISCDPDRPYDVLGANWKMSTDNIKKKYWKLSLMVHPDKCSHPQAHQAFVVLNKSFKLLQDADKRKEIDEKIKHKEELEQFKVELRSLREAAQWRKLQGISMEGDDLLLAEENVETEQPQARDEWMTTLPPERKHGVTMQSTKTFSRAGKEGRGDTSAWTDSPLDKVQKAKLSYCEAYNKLEAAAAAETSSEAADSEKGMMRELVNKYNKSKRPTSLVEKHKEESRRRSKGKGMTEQLPEKGEEWTGQHPWKPWDREKDLSAGRQKVNFDSKNMSEGLSSRFSSGAIQRNFL